MQNAEKAAQGRQQIISRTKASAVHSWMNEA